MTPPRNPAALQLGCFAALGLAWLIAAPGGCTDGRCDEPCADGWRCVDGRCRLPCPDDGGCAAGEVCYRGYCEVGDRRPGADDEAAAGDPPGGEPSGADGDGAPATCGNDLREGTEVCDGTDLGGVTTCVDLSFGSGTPTCMLSCSDYDLSSCSGPAGSCNGGMASGREQCDGVDLRGQTCATLGFASGTLDCNPNCSFDVSGCQL